MQTGRRLIFDDLASVGHFALGFGLSFAPKDLAAFGSGAFIVYELGQTYDHPSGETLGDLIEFGLGFLMAKAFK